MTKGNWALIALAAFLLFLILFLPQYGWRLREGFAPQAKNLTPELTLELIQENQKLKAELAVLESVKSRLPARSQSYVPAIVLSRYPLNFKNELLVGADENDGIEPGAGVVFGGILIGKVEKVFGGFSVIKTVFDGDFQTSVRIGPLGIDAILRGGLTPKAALIPLDVEIKEGDIVYSASPEFQHGLPVGEVKNVSVSADKLFQEATLGFMYGINEVRSVLVQK